MELQELFSKQNSDYQQTPYLSYETRCTQLKLLKKMLQQHADQLTDAVSHDFSSRSPNETLLTEIFLSVNTINYCLKNSKRWMKHKKRHVSWQFKPTYAYILPQPLGVVGIMVPWNYPIYLAMAPIAYAVSAGNRVMVKMSELSPHTGALLASLIQEAGIDETKIAILNGDVDVSKAFSGLPFAHLLFTGSSKVGKDVMLSASKHLTPVTLELGGKSPTILSSTVKKEYLARIFMGKLFNAGQTCIAPDYLMIPEHLKSDVITAFQAFIHTHYPNIMQNSDYTSIISEEHAARLGLLISDAEQKGAEVITVGEMSKDRRKIPPCLLFNTNDAMQVMHEEIFGPILPVIFYTSFKDAMHYINQKPNPLVLYYFGENKDEINELQLKTLSGALVVNQTGLSAALDNVPFGGVGNSGMGQYHGPEGFNTFSKLKPVIISGRFSSLTWLYPPYGKLLRIFLKWAGGIKLNDKG